MSWQCVWQILTTIFCQAPHPSPHPTSYYYKVCGSSCLLCVLGVVKMICNLIWPWVLLLVFVLGRNNNVKFSWCKVWKDFYLKGDMWNFLNIYLEVFLFFSFFMNTTFRKEEGSYTCSSWLLHLVIYGYLGSR